MTLARKLDGLNLALASEGPTLTGGSGETVPSDKATFLLPRTPIFANLSLRLTLISSPSSLLAFRSLANTLVTLLILFVSPVSPTSSPTSDPSRFSCTDAGLEVTLIISWFPAQLASSLTNVEARDRVRAAAVLAAAAAAILATLAVTLAREKVEG
jgi:hypothetical protein